jgi:hypothetical protein
MTDPTLMMASDWVSLALATPHSTTSLPFYQHRWFAVSLPSVVRRSFDWTIHATRDVNIMPAKPTRLHNLIEFILRINQKLHNLIEFILRINQNAACRKLCVGNLARGRYHCTHASVGGRSTIQSKFKKLLIKYWNGFSYFGAKCAFPSKQEIVGKTSRQTENLQSIRINFCPLNLIDMETLLTDVRPILEYASLYVRRIMYMK